MRQITVVRSINVAAWALLEWRRWRAAKRTPASAAVQRAAAEGFVARLVAMGPAFVKLGQILSTRPDFLPRPFIEALAVLHEHVPSVGYDAVERVIHTELGRSVDEVYATFDHEPIAAGSLAQVHRAELRDGRSVAVKVQRPGVRERIESDLAALGALVGLAIRLRPRWARNLDLRGAFTQFAAYTRRELEFDAEGRTLERFRENFRDGEHVRFPLPESDLTTARLLTMEHLDGLRLHQAPERLSAGSRLELADHLVAALMKMFVVDGFFHADLHPGNVFLGADGGVRLIDVGMVGELTADQRGRFLLYWLAISRGERDRAFSHLERLVRPGLRADRARFRSAYDALLDVFYAATITERSWTQTFFEIIVAAARHGYTVPSEMLLEAKALTTAEALLFVLAPETKFAELARPHVEREVARQASSENLRRRLFHALPEWLLFGESAPAVRLEALPTVESTRALWNDVAQGWATEMDDHPHKARETVHGISAVVINRTIADVFHFVCRLARYEQWHPTYTLRSRVIHVGGGWIFLMPGGVGSVFRLDEIVDGYSIQSNGVVTEFEPNRRFKWRAPFSLVPLVHMGTCFDFQDVGDGRTRLQETFYYLDNELVEMLRHRSWLGAVEALEHHMTEELNGVKRLLEAGDYDAEDLTDLWADVTAPTRVARNYLQPAGFERDSQPLKAADPTEDSTS